MKCMRVVVYFMTDDLACYHQLCLNYQIRRQAEFYHEAEWIAGRQYGPLGQHPGGDRPESLPAGPLAASICSIIRAHTAALPPCKFNPVVALADLTMCPIIAAGYSISTVKPQLIFMVDCPTFVGDSVLTAIHMQILHSFPKGFCETNRLSYQIFKYLLAPAVVESEARE